VSARERSERALSAVLRAEARKALATPTIWWLLLATVAIGVAGTVAPLVAADKDRAKLLTDRTLQQAMHGAAGGVILVVVAGIIGMAGEWRFGQASQTFLASPRRTRVIAAKTVVYMVAGAVFGTAAAAASAVTAWLWYRANDVALPLERSAVWLTLLGCLAVAVLFGVLGVAIGALARNQVVAIVGSMAWLVVIEPILFASSSNVFRWLPGMASISLRRQPADGLLPAGSAAAVLVGIIAVLLAVGTWLVERDDVTA
jgi:ABC-2 type transport system permease protein